MLYVLISIFFFYTIYKIFLNLLEINFIKSKMFDKAVILGQNDYENSAKISIENKKFSIFSSIFSFCMFLFWALYGVEELQKFMLVNDTIFQNTACVILFLFINSLAGMPFDIYEKFIKDRRFGFSNITPKIFILDFVKSTFLMVFFGGLVVYLMLFCMDFLGKFWWFYAFLLFFAIVLLINLIYPTLIAPIFNKVSPLDDDLLRTQIQSLLLKSGFKSSGIFVMDASKRDNRLNAYFGGLGKTKRVVLFDTLLQKLETNEILAVLGHELGHFKHKDIVKNIFMIFIILFFLFFIFGNLPLEIYSSLGFMIGSELPFGSSFLIFVFMFSPILEAFFEPILSYFSRKNEFNADKFGADIQSPLDMKSALVKLGKENKAFPISHPFYSAIYHSHPTLFERISRLE